MGSFEIFKKREILPLCTYTLEGETIRMKHIIADTRWLLTCKNSKFHLIQSNMISIAKW